MSNIPKTILIKHDDHHAKYIGNLKNENQFILTNPFVPAIGGKVVAGSDCVAP